MKGLKLLCSEDEQSRSCWMAAFRLFKVSPEPALPAPAGETLGWWQRGAGGTQEGVWRDNGGILEEYWSDAGW